MESNIIFTEEKVKEALKNRMNEYITRENLQVEEDKIDKLLNRIMTVFEGRYHEIDKKRFDDTLKSMDITLYPYFNPEFARKLKE